MAFTLCVHIPGASSSSYEDASHIELGPIITTSFDVNYFFKDPGSKFSQRWGLGLQRMTFEVDTIWPIAPWDRHMGDYAFAFQGSVGVGISAPLTRWNTGKG